MPNYDYGCKACNKVWEEFHSISNRDMPTEEPCPHCKKSGKVVREWLQAPTGGVDATLGPGKDFKDMVKKIKASGQVPKRFHENLDRAASRTGMRLGTQ